MSNTLVGTQVLFPKDTQTSVNMSQASPGPFPCPGGDIIAPFAQFPDPKPGTARWYRLKAVYYDENAGGTFNIRIDFNLFSGKVVTFNLPQVSSGAGASNFHYSDWYKPGTVPGDYAHITAYFVNHAVYNNSAAIYSLILEAHDVYQPGTSTSHSYTVTVANKSALTLETHNGDFIAPGASWTSEALGNGFVTNPQLGTLSFVDIGETHVDGDSSEKYGTLVSLRAYDYVGRYDANGRLSVTINPLLQATLSGMDLNPVSLDALTSS